MISDIDNKAKMLHTNNVFMAFAALPLAVSLVFSAVSAPARAAGNAPAVVKSTEEAGVSSTGAPNAGASNAGSAGARGDSGEVAAKSADAAGYEVDIRDIRGPAPLFLEGRPFPYLWAVLALLASYILWRRLTRAVPQEPVPAPKVEEKSKIPAHVTALAAFDELFRSDMIRNRRFKEWYMAVSRILRVYLGDSLDFNCVDLYNFEIMDVLRAKKVNWANIDEFDEILSECDLVKFARFEPNEIEAIEILKKSVDMVKKTEGGNFGC